MHWIYKQGTDPPSRTRRRANADDWNLTDFGTGRVEAVAPDLWAWCRCESNFRTFCAMKGLHRRINDSLDHSFYEAGIRRRHHRIVDVAENGHRNRTRMRMRSAHDDVGRRYACLNRNSST